MSGCKTCCGDRTKGVEGSSLSLHGLKHMAIQLPAPKYMEATAVRLRIYRAAVTFTVVHNAPAALLGAELDMLNNMAPTGFLISETVFRHRPLNNEMTLFIFILRPRSR
jgi:hypothetical protein